MPNWELTNSGEDDGNPFKEFTLRPTTVEDMEIIGGRAKEIQHTIRNIHNVSESVYTNQGNFNRSMSRRYSGVLRKYLGPIVDIFLNPYYYKFEQEGASSRFDFRHRNFTWSSADIYIHQGDLGMPSICG